MFDRLSIRTKLIAIVVAPLAVIIVFAGMGYTQRKQESAATRADVARLESIDAAQALQHELQLETLHSVNFLTAEPTELPKVLVDQRKAVDDAATSLEGTLDDLSDEDATAIAAAEGALRQVDLLETTLRGQIDAKALEWAWIEELYGQVENSIPPISDRLIANIEDAELVDGARSVVALGEYGSSLAEMGILLVGASGSGSYDAAVRESFIDAAERAEIQLAIVSAEAGAQVRVRLRNQMAGSDVKYFEETVEYTLALDDEVDALTVDVDRATNATIASLDQLRDIANAEAETVLAEAGDRVDAADRAARFFLIGAILAVATALGLAIVGAASIARPVLRLTRAADRVATEQLPRMVEALRNPTDETNDLQPDLDDIEVGGGRELAQLAASVNSIQGVAVQVATEQASLLRKGIGDMFVNLARRNQGLLDRQLEYIDELESKEEDPDQLEHLFRLDHMATRMRRNAESLLVLAGAEPNRRRGKPVPLTKVALAAVGEIEHFARVDLLDVEEVDVASKAAADIAHLLSELMENATQFSPPDSRVEVIGNRSEVGSYSVSITDQGIGMSPEQLAEANELLAHPPLLGLTLARTLGFIVVGRLASRHGISVRLVASPTGGVTAIVGLPATVLVARTETVDLTTPSQGPDLSSPFANSTPFGGPSALDAPPTPSSILPPFEFSSFEEEPEDLVPPTPLRPEPVLEDEPAPVAMDSTPPMAPSHPRGGRPQRLGVRRRPRERRGRARPGRHPAGARRPRAAARRPGRPGRAHPDGGRRRPPAPAAHPQPRVDARSPTAPRPASPACSEGPRRPPTAAAPPRRPVAPACSAGPPPRPPLLRPSRRSPPPAWSDGCPAAPSAASVRCPGPTRGAGRLLHLDAVA